MATPPATSRFQAKLHRPQKPTDDTPWTFILLPKEVSDTLPRRGRTTVTGTLNNHPFQATLEPDGNLSHWLKVTQELQTAANIQPDELITIELSPTKEPDPQIPHDLKSALKNSPEAHQTWKSTTNIARLDWIHWIVIAKQAKTRQKRIRDACDMLTKGKKRVCCFDPSGHYSKAFKAPTPAE